MSIQCQHGQLRRQCELCELEAVNDALRRDGLEALSEWAAVEASLESEITTLRAQLAEVTRERDGLLLRTHRLGWLVNEMRSADIYYVLGDHWNFDRATLEESIRAAMQETQP